MLEGREEASKDKERVKGEAQVRGKPYHVYERQTDATRYKPGVRRHTQATLLS